MDILSQTLRCLAHKIKHPDVPTQLLDIMKTELCLHVVLICPFGLFFTEIHVNVIILDFELNCVQCNNSARCWTNANSAIFCFPRLLFSPVHSSPLSVFCIFNVSTLIYSYLMFLSLEELPCMYRFLSPNFQNMESKQRLSIFHDKWWQW